MCHPTRKLEPVSHIMRAINSADALKRRHKSHSRNVVHNSLIPPSDSRNPRQPQHSGWATAPPCERPGIDSPLEAIAADPPDSLPCQANPAPHPPEPGKRAPKNTRANRGPSTTKIAPIDYHWRHDRRLSTLDLGSVCRTNINQVDRTSIEFHIVSLVNVILKDIISVNVAVTISDNLPQFLISSNIFGDLPFNN